MLVYDSVTVYMRLFLMVFAVLFVILSRLTGIADRDDGQDYYTLVFGATIGMCLMASRQPPAHAVSWASRWRACRRMCWPASSRAGSGAARRR